MVYIYKKIIGQKVYYYLRASKKKGNKFATKDIAYLGNSIEEVKKALSNLQGYKAEIRKAYRLLNSFIESNYYLEKASSLKLKDDQYLSRKQMQAVEACRIHYNNIFQKKEDLTRKDILKNFVIEFAFNTASIEGNTITLQEAKNLLEEGLTPKNKTLREIYDIQNTERVFFSLLNSEEELSHNFIVNVHSNLMENIDPRIGYRDTDVHVFKASFKATPFPYIKTDVGLLLDWHEKNKEKLHPLVLAVIFHHKFEKIHPFMDGNGRTGRMLMNYILLKNNYPPIIIRKKERQGYLEALRKADKGDLNNINKKNYQDLMDFTANEMIGGYWNIFL